MNKKIVIALMAASFFVATHGGAQAEFNARPHIAPGQQVKINKAMARLRRDGGSRRNNTKFGTEGGCGNIVLGDVGNSKRPPREIIVIANDIININQNCKR